MYNTNQTNLKQILAALKSSGFPEAVHLTDDEGSDIRNVLAKEVTKYKTKFLVSLTCWLPLIWLTWVIP